VRGDLVQVARIALLEPEVRETMLPGTVVSGLDEVAGDVDAQHVRPAARRGQRRCAVATAEIEYPEPRLHAEALDQRLTALPHALRDAGEVALLPECLVRIHVSSACWPCLTRRRCRPAASRRRVSSCDASVRGTAQS